MIKPTLFVGLGTTGTEILKTLRQLMSEEFKVSGLPLFRYISVETREAETGDNSPRHSEDYEKITVVNATIESTAPIKNKLDSNHPSYNPHLTGWLNSHLLDYIQSFEDGARNIRMAGRLCFWENWREIRTILDRARNAIINANNRNETLEILRQHYEAKNLPVPAPLVDENGINVYVVGTLCGGTCSGMLIDMAYFLRTLLGGSNANRIYGIFTMFDRPLAEDSAEDIAVHAANCYAGLSELNYYSHTGTPYDVTFPNNRRINTKQIPFNYAMFVSPSGKLPNIRFTVDEVVDVEGLNWMVALNLFAEAVGDPNRQKEAIRTDWVGLSGYGGLKDVREGEIKTMVKCLASFGLTAVWYPKYRIASAAACLAGQRLCQNWLKTHTDRAEIRAEAVQAWNDIKRNVDILTSPQVTGGTALRGEIEFRLNTASQAFNQAASADDLEHEMNAFPGTKEKPDPFNMRFAEGGQYFTWMQEKIDNCIKTFDDAIGDILRNQLSRIGTENTYGLGNVQAFFEEFDHILNSAQQQCPSQLPLLNLNALDFQPMHSAKNFWTKLAGNQEEAVKAHRTRLIQEYRQLILGSGNQRGIFQKVRDYFLRQVLEAARARLGFGRDTDGPTIRAQLAQIEANLQGCDRALQEDYESEIQPPRFRCVKIVTNNPQNSIGRDAEPLSNQIIDDITPAELFVENDNLITMDVFLNEAEGDIKFQTVETCRRLALHKINSDDEGMLGALVVTKAQEILNTTDEEIRDLATRSNPYQEFTEEYQRFDLSEQGGPKIIFGHDPTETRDILNDLQMRLNFGRSGDSSVDHLLFFYEEEASFTFDDLAAYEALKQHFDEKPGVYGHWTHQDPNVYDLTLTTKREKLARWCCALAQLVPEIRKSIPQAFNDIFEYQGEDIIFTYQDETKVDKPLSMFDDEVGMKELCRQENEAVYHNFFNAVIAEFNKVGQLKASEFVNGLTRQEGDIDTRRELAASFSQFMQEVYPNGDVATETTYHSAPTEDSRSAGKEQSPAPADDDDFKKSEETESPSD